MISRATERTRDPVSRRGSVTVEASISIALFVFAMVSILSLINICRLQRRIGHALNCAALDISRYSYFFYVTGGYDAISTVRKTADDLIDGIGHSDNPGIGSKALAELAKVLLADDQGTTEADFTWGGDTTDVSNEDPISLLLSTLSERVEDNVSGLIAGSIVRALFRCELGLPDTAADRYLRSHGVIGGWGGLDFEISRLWSERSPCDISLAVRYRIRIPFLPGMTIPFVQRAVTGAWLGGDMTAGADGSSYSIDDYYNGGGIGSIWKLSAFDRGKVFREEFSKNYPNSDAIEGMHGVIGYDPAANTYYNCVSINTFSESYNDEGFQAAKACEHTVRRLKLTVSELAERLHEGSRAFVEYTVFIPEDASGEVRDEICRYLAAKGEQLQERYPIVDITFRIERAGGNART